MFLRNIYYGLIHSNILYGLEIYGNASHSQLDKLIKLNNKILRILQFKTIETSNVVIYRNYNTLPIPTLFKYKILTLVHNFKHHKDKLPVIFKNYFTENCMIHTYATRNSDNLHIISTNSCYGARTIVQIGSAYWNQLPKSLKLYVSTKEFQRKLKLYLQYQL